MHTFVLFIRYWWARQNHLEKKNWESGNKKPPSLLCNKHIRQTIFTSSPWCCILLFNSCVYWAIHLCPCEDTAAEMEQWNTATLSHDPPFLPVWIPSAAKFRSLLAGRGTECDRVISVAVTARRHHLSQFITTATLLFTHWCGKAHLGQIYIRNK